MNLKKLVLACGAAGALVGSTLAFGSTYYLATANGPQLATVQTPSSTNSTFVCYTNSDYLNTTTAFANLGLSIPPAIVNNVLTPTAVTGAECIDAWIFNEMSPKVGAAEAKAGLSATFKASMTTEVKNTIASGDKSTFVTLKLPR